MRALEIGVAGMGVSCLLAWALACAQAAHHQAQASADFDRALAARLHGEAPDTREWSETRVRRFESLRGAPVRALARLEIPDAGISVMVLDGTSEETLDRAVGRIEGTARPGEPGNVGIAGHRDGWFRGLRHLEPGDAIRLQTLEGLAHYEVEEIRVVTPDRVDVLAPSDEDVLTLVTCHPFYFVGDAPDRYIVRARMLRYEPGPAGERLARSRPPS